MRDSQGGQRLTFIITTYVNEGIVMACDSRLTLSRTLTNDNQFKGQQTQVLMDIVQSDANFKKMKGPISTTFHVAGYKSENNKRVQQVWRVSIDKSEKVQVNSAGDKGV